MMRSSAYAQQAVEKSLKAWIAAIGGSYGRIHDLGQLFLLLADLGCDVTEFEELDVLNPFAVAFRYEALDFDEPKLDRVACMAQVKRLYDPQRDRCLDGDCRGDRGTGREQAYEIRCGQL
jgi:hypothetical protein